MNSRTRDNVAAPPWQGWAAFTLIELIVVITIVVVLGFILLPGMWKAKDRAMRIQCTSNLKQITLSFKVWALDNHDLFPAQALTNQSGMLEPEAATNVYVHFMVMSNELSTPKILVCPDDPRRLFATSFTSLGSSNISYFVGLDAQNTAPLMFLAGDRNLTNGLPVTNHVLFLATNLPAGWTHEMHHLQGNIGLADGSVQQFSRWRLTEAITNASAGNRLLMP